MAPSGHRGNFDRRNSASLSAAAWPSAPAMRFLLLAIRPAPLLPLCVPHPSCVPPLASSAHRAPSSSAHQPLPASPSVVFSSRFRYGVNASGPIALTRSTAGVSGRAGLSRMAKLFASFYSISPSAALFPFLHGFAPLRYTGDSVALFAPSPFSRRGYSTCLKIRPSKNPLPNSLDIRAKFKVRFESRLLTARVFRSPFLSKIRIFLGVCNIIRLFLVVIRYITQENVEKAILLQRKTPGPIDNCRPQPMELPRPSLFARIIRKCNCLLTARYLSMPPGFPVRKPFQIRKIRNI